MDWEQPDALPADLPTVQCTTCGTPLDPADVADWFVGTEATTNQVLAWRLWICPHCGECVTDTTVLPDPSTATA